MSKKRGGDYVKSIELQIQERLNEIEQLKKQLENEKQKQQKLEQQPNINNIRDQLKSQIEEIINVNKT